MQDQAQGNGEANILGSFYSKLFPPGVSEVNHDDQEDIKEAGGAKGHPIAHFSKIDNNVITKVTGRNVSNQKLQVSG